jgi:cytochrome c oxidase subunit 2
MLLRIAATRRSVSRLASMLCVLGLVLAGCSPDHYPQTTLRPLSDFAKIGDDIQTTTFWWALGVFILVEGALVYAIFRFRGKPGDPEPKQIHGNTTVEILWTAIPALILAAIAVPTVKGIFATAATPHGDALTVEVIGHQWWWEFRYADLNIVTANVLVVPVNTVIEVAVESTDVEHGFWAPELFGKVDAVPGYTNRVRFTPTEIRDYFGGQCTQFCGIQHTQMRMAVTVMAARDFQAWASNQQQPSAKPETLTGDAKAGQELFASQACVGCHTINGTAAAGLTGPNLTHLMSRGFIAGGVLANTPENLHAWIKNSEAVKVGNTMGIALHDLHLTDEQVNVLVAYLTTLK